jgi:hypothetical protein
MVANIAPPQRPRKPSLPNVAFLRGGGRPRIYEDRVEVVDGEEIETRSRVAAVLEDLGTPDRRLLLQLILRELIEDKPRTVQLRVVREVAQSCEAILRLSRHAQH